MSDYQTIFVSEDQLIDSPQQPPSRTAPSASMKNLQNSIKNDKLQYPPLVMATPDGRYQIIDGHRRIAAMKQLGHLKFPVIPTVGRPEKLFAAVCSNVAKMTAAQWVTVFLKAGEESLPRGQTKGCIKKLNDVMGRDYLVRLEKRGLSPILWNLANRVVKYCGLGEGELKEVLEWLLNESVNSHEVSAWISANNKVDELVKAIRQKRAPKY